MTAQRRAAVEQLDGEQLGTVFKPYVPGPESAGLLAVQGCGKSYAVKVDWVPFLRKQGCAVAFWDSSDEHTIHGKRRPGNILGSLRQRLTVPELHEAVSVDRRVVTRRDLELGIVPSSPFLTPKQLAAEFRSVLPILLGRGNGLVFFVEEVAQLCDHAEPELVQLAAVWPKDISTVFMGQTPNMFPPAVRGNWTRCISGAQTKASDRQTIGADFGKRYAARLANLKRGEFLVALSRPSWAVTPSRERQ
ncbi:hypothetical protein NR798_24170 [Archangium gephyra]|uniref:hypothetical protein n=1 Tax=Archangium gephyra TaxID=48 RepID=UPI0035D41A1B